MSAARAARKLKSAKSTIPLKRPAPTPATIQQHKLSLLDSLSRSLDSERSLFAPPTELAFIPTASLENLKLDYSASNSRVHAYEDFLVKHLIEYDRIESDGDPIIRQERKRGVNQVEAELERLDQLKRTAFLHSSERQSSSRQVFSRNSPETLLS